MRRIGGREEGNGMMILSRGNDDMYRSFLSLSLFGLPYYNCIIDVHENEWRMTCQEILFFLGFAPAQKQRSRNILSTSQFLSSITFPACKSAFAVS